MECPSQVGGLLPPGSPLSPQPGSHCPPSMETERHCVPAGKGDVQQCWVQGKEMPQARRAAPLCHWGKAEPKGPGAGGPSLRLLLFLTLLSYFLFSLLSAQPSLPSAMTITKPRWRRTLSSCLPHDLHQAMALSVRAAGRLVSVMTDAGRRGARCPSMCLRVGKAQLCLPASP